MKKHWKLIVGIVLLIGGLMNVGKNSSAVIAGLLVGAALIVWSIIDTKKSSSELHSEKVSTPLNSPTITNSAPVVTTNTQINNQKTITVPSSIDGCKLAYHYDDVKIFIPEESPNLSVLTPGAPIRFELEPNNKYDNKAVAVFTEDDNKLGYLYKGRLQDMVRDFQAKKLPIISHITYIDDEEHIVKLFIGFYRNKEQPRTFDKTYKLIGNSNNDMQEIILLCAEGEEVEYEFDYEKEKYLASSGGDIGYFPKSANEVLKDNPRAFIYEIDEDEKGKYAVLVGVET